MSDGLTTGSDATPDGANVVKVLDVAAGVVADVVADVVAVVVADGVAVELVAPVVAVRDVGVLRVTVVGTVGFGEAVSAAFVIVVVGNGASLSTVSFVVCTHPLSKPTVPASTKRRLPL